MFPYWLLFAFFAIGSFVAHPRRRSDERYRSPILVMGFVGMTFMIGTRYWVGLDWMNYYRQFRAWRYGELLEVIGRGDPAYVLLNRIVTNLDGPFWVVNLVSAAIFAWGLYRFVTSQPEPWLATLVAVPYLIVVVAMGYTRQAAAIGFVLVGLAALIRERPFWRFLPYVVLASLFHSSAVLVLPLAMIGVKSGRLAKWLLVPVAIYALYSFNFADRFESYRHYLNPAMQSQGAAVRILLGVLPAVLFLVAHKKLAYSATEAAIWRNFSLAALGLLVLLFVLPSSTVLDRIGLYIVPLQMAVLGRAPLLLNHPVGARSAIIIYSGIILFVWLNFAQFAHGWNPYRSYFSPDFEERRSR